MSQVKIERVYPPIHSVAVVVLCLGVFTAYLPTMFKSLEEVASIETLSRPIFSHYIDTVTLGWIRCIISICMFRVSAARMMSERLDQSSLVSLHISLCANKYI